MADWTTIVNTTTNDFLKDVEVNILRTRKLLALLQSKGRVSYKNGGILLDWKVQYKRAPLIGFADGDTVTFARRDRWKTAQLPWRGYQIPDMMSKMDRLKNSGTSQIVDMYATIVDNMMDDIEDQFGDQLYINGNAAGNSKLMHGIETFTSGGTQVAGQPNATPTVTYANLSTVPGNYGGNWSAVWPQGHGDAHYDFWSPILVDYTNTFWAGSGTQTWAKNCIDAIRFLLIKSRRSKSKKGMLDLVLLNDELYRQFLTAIDGRQRLVISRNEKEGLFALGFQDVVNFDGCDVTSEYGVPDSSGYGFNTMQMELMSMQDKLFEATGPVWSDETSTYRFLIDFYGNARFNPRSQGKLFNYT